MPFDLRPRKQRLAEDKRDPFHAAMGWLIRIQRSYILPSTTQNELRVFIEQVYPWLASPEFDKKDKPCDFCGGKVEPVLVEQHGIVCLWFVKSPLREGGVVCQTCATDEMFEKMPPLIYSNVGILENVRCPGCWDPPHGISEDAFIMPVVKTRRCVLCETDLSDVKKNVRVLR